MASNNAYAAAGLAGAGTTTNYLRCTGYNFSIPAGSVISGIIVNVERKSSSVAAGGLRDAAVRAIKGGAIGAVDRASGSNYTTADVTEAHGSAVDLWGETWTAGDINSANFGAAFATLKNSAGGGTFTASVDVMSITVMMAPTIASMTRVDPDPTAAATVRWSVTFSEPLGGVDLTDFSLTASGLSGASCCRSRRSDDIHGHGQHRLWNRHAGAESGRR